MRNHSASLILSQHIRVSICEKCCFDGMTSLKNLDMIRKLFDISRLSKIKRHSKKYSQGHHEKPKESFQAATWIKNELTVQNDYIGECAIIPSL